MALKKKINFSIISALSFILVPLLLTGAVLYAVLTSEDFYIYIIKSADPVAAFVEARNLQTEKDIMRQVERKTGLAEFRPEYERIEALYRDTAREYNRLNRTEKFSRIEKEIEALDDMDWENAPETFKTRKEFEKFRKTRLADLNRAKEEIEKYRDSNEEIIDNAEDAMEDAEEDFEDAKDELKDKEEEAREIVSSRRDELSASLVADIAKIEPALTEKLNTLFIEREIRRVIKYYIDFFSAYEKQKKAGKIFTRRLDIKSGRIENTPVVILPPLRISLFAEDEIRGVKARRHIFSEIIPSVIDSAAGLANPWILKKIFTLSDTWLAEAAGRAVLKKTGLTMRDGIVSSKKIVLEGDKAVAARYLMIAATWGRHALWMFPLLAAALLLFITATAADRKSGIRKAGTILKYPFAALSVTCIAVIIFCASPGTFISLPKIFSDPLISTVGGKLLLNTAIHIFLPPLLIFLIISAAGSLIIKKASDQ